MLKKAWKKRIMKCIFGGFIQEKTLREAIACRGIVILLPPPLPLPLYISYIVRRFYTSYFNSAVLMPNDRKSLMIKAMRAIQHIDKTAKSLCILILFMTIKEMMQYTLIVLKKFFVISSRSDVDRDLFT